MFEVQYFPLVGMALGTIVVGAYLWMKPKNRS